MIIAIDGASTDLSLSIADPADGLLAEDAWTSPQRQSAELLPRLLALLDANQRRIAEVTAVAVGTGPGSFTGLRVAMALAKGIALGLGRPIVGVPSLEAWLDAEPDAVAAVARAGASEAYVQLRGETAPVIADRTPLLERLAGRTVVASSELTAFGIDDARPPRGAAAILERAAARLAADPAGDDLATLEPRYLRAPRGVEGTPEGVARWH